MTLMNARGDPAGEALRVSESRYRRLFETAQDGILLLNANTAQIEDVNPYLIDMLGYSHAEFLGKKLWEVGSFKDIEQSKEMFAELQTTGYVRYKDLPLKTKTGAKIAVEFVSNSYDCEGIKVIQCNIRNITERKADQAKIQRHTQLYIALSQCNKAIVHCTSEEELFLQVCRAAVQFGGMKMAWVGIVDNETLLVRPAASFGNHMEYLAGLNISVAADSPFGCGPIGTAIRENRPFWCQDFGNEPVAVPWPEYTAQAGFVGLVSLPLHRNGAVIGAFTLYSGEVDSFDQSARDLLTEMAVDISFALDNFARESQRRQALDLLLATEEKYRGLVEQAITGICIIQDGKFAYVNPRAAEIISRDSAAELIGSDPLLWVAEADRSAVAETLRQLLGGEARSVALEFAGLRRDGVMIQVGANAARATHEGRPAIIAMMQDISERKRSEEDIRRYVEQLKIAFMSTVEVATIISEMRDPYTAGHERRVAEIAVAIGAEMGFDEDRQQGLQVAGHLHDVGKISIPSEILSKPGRLSAIEFQLVQGHARSSYDVLKGVAFPWPVAQVALQHHERMDGSGYPQGLKGESIMFEARIVAVADVVEAMSSHRPYRPGLGIEMALTEIERGSGMLYDVDVSVACLRLFREKCYQVPA
jgi:PAS domain S-box-containing protein